MSRTISVISIVIGLAVALANAARMGWPLWAIVLLLLVGAVGVTIIWRKKPDA